MAINFVVETGEGIADANSYIDLTYFKQFMDNNGTDYTGKTDDELSVDLIKATDYTGKTDDELSVDLIKATSYLERKYSYNGNEKKPREQGLKWPRVDATDKRGNKISVDTVPREAMKATALAAIIQLTDPNGLDYIKPVEGVIKSTSSKLGPLSDATEYMDGSQTSLARIFVDVEEAIRPITSGGSGLLPTSTSRF